MQQQKMTAHDRLRMYEEKGCHMLIPSAISVEEIAPGFALVVETVLLKPHPRDKEVYANDSKQYDYQKNDWNDDARTGNELVRIHKQGFDRLAQAAKIDWLPPQIVRDPHFPGRMMASVEGMIRTSTGELYRVSDAKGMDLDIVREQLEFQYKNNKSKAYLVDRDLLHKKQFQQEMCISGAKNRVIKQLLCIANAYTVNDLKKEFVVVRIVPKLDTNDEYTRKRLVDVQIAAMAGIYGLLPSPSPQPPPAIEMVGNIPDSALQDDENVVNMTETGNGKFAHQDEPPPPPLPDPEDSRRVDFQDMDVSDQAIILVRMAKEKGFPLTDWLKKFKTQPMTIEMLTPMKRLDLYNHLDRLKAANSQRTQQSDDAPPFAMTA